MSTEARQVVARALHQYRVLRLLLEVAVAGVVAVAVAAPSEVRRHLWVALYQAHREAHREALLQLSVHRALRQILARREALRQVLVHREVAHLDVN